MTKHDIQDSASALKQLNKSPNEGLGIPGIDIALPEGQYPDESPSWDKQRNGEAPGNHGFPVNPLEHLEAQLDLIDEMDKAEEEYWDNKHSEDNSELEADGKIKPLASQDMPGNEGYTFEELTSPMTSEQIMARRKNKPQKREPRYSVETRVFVLGGHADKQKWGDDGQPIPAYDDSDERVAYETLISNVLNSNGKSVLANKQVEGIMNTSKFKIYVEVLHLID